MHYKMFGMLKSSYRSKICMKNMQEICNMYMQIYNSSFPYPNAMIYNGIPLLSIDHGGTPHYKSQNTLRHTYDIDNVCNIG